MTEHRVRCGKLRLNVAAASEYGPPLFLLHGVTRRWQDWLTVLPAFATRWGTTAVDLRGHGRSDRAPKPDDYRVADYVADIAKLVKKHAESPAILVGHSLGAMVAAAVAAEIPKRVCGLVLEDPTYEMTGVRRDETSFPDLFRAFAIAAGSDRDAATLAAELAAAPVRVAGRAEPVAMVTLRDPASLRFSAASLKRLDPAVLVPASDGRWLDGYDVTATLAAVRCPTLIVQADFAAGGALPDDYAVELAGQVPDATLVRLPGVGHNAHAAAPEAFLKVVLPFLGALE